VYQPLCFSFVFSVSLLLVPCVMLCRSLLDSSPSSFLSYHRQVHCGYFYNAMVVHAGDCITELSIKCQGGTGLPATTLPGVPMSLCGVRSG
jgi:hypothetical protein